MKRWIALFLCLCLTMSLCACGGEEQSGKEGKDGLQVGFGRAQITPENSVPMAGYTDTSSRMSTGFRDYLYATCLAFTEGDNTVLIFSQDLFKTEGTWAEQVRAMIAQQTGIPAEKILICATHNHAGPDTSSGHSAIAAYKTLYMERLTQAAKAALEDRAPATLYSTATQTEKLNFPRHYKLSDGSYGGDVFGDFESNTILGYADEGDPTMLLVKADREGDKQDILIMNYQVYPCVLGVSGDTNLSSDFIGLARNKIEQETGMLCAYFSGAGGNVKPQSRLPEDKHTLSDEQYSAAVAQCAIDALPSLSKLEGSGVDFRQSKFSYAVNHDDAHLLVQAREVVELSKTAGAAAAGVRAKELGLLSAYHAQQIVSRQSRPETAAMELDAVKVGGLAFVTAPYEMFSQSGKFIRQESPFGATVVCSCANGYFGNFATTEAYEYNSYESYMNYFAKGCAEAAAEEFVRLLKDMQ